MRSKKYLKAALLALFVLGASIPMMAHDSMSQHEHGSAQDCKKAYDECKKGCTSNDKNCTNDCAKEYAECRGMR